MGSCQDPRVQSDGQRRTDMEMLQKLPQRRTGIRGDIQTRVAQLGVIRGKDAQLNLNGPGVNVVIRPAHKLSD